ncbi:MAG: REP-associated tyrosine transposase [Candidatus Acidiferrales bacterium]
MFRKPELARILVEQILHCRDRGFYGLHSFVVVPEHFHVLLTPSEGTTLEKAVQMIKGGSAYRMRKELDHKRQVWQPGYHDCWIRDAQEYEIRKRYIALNPVTARLVDRAEEYPLSSANGSFRLNVSQFEETGTSGAKAPAVEPS